MIAIVDYGAGNLFSVANALEYLELPYVVTSEKQALREADGLILPGVGAFPDAMRQLQKSGLIPTLCLQAEKKPLLGICLGMQLLFERGYEFQACDGLSLIPGTVRLIKSNGLKIPHMGWNDLRIHAPSPLTEGIDDGDYVYFVHSYMADCDDDFITASCAYGEQVPAIVTCGHVCGCQFHPEKSGDVGLTILRNFGRMVEGKA